MLQHGLGGLNVQSHLGEPFTGSITVTGEEAQALLNGGKATISNGNLRAAVRKSGDKAVVTIRSSKAIKDPVLVFQVGVGAQSREYTAIIDPAGYDAKDAASVRTRQAAESQSFEPTRNTQQPATKNNKSSRQSGSSSALKMRNVSLGWPVFLRTKGQQGGGRG